MQTFWLILLAAPGLLIAVLAFLGLLVTGIRRAGCGSIRHASGGRVDSITRRVLGVGVRNPSSNDKSR
jgi:hypothetical protein